jgi:hypothetical protein
MLMQQADELVSISCDAAVVRRAAERLYGSTIGNIGAYLAIVEEGGG